MTIITTSVRRLNVNLCIYHRTFHSSAPQAEYPVDVKFSINLRNVLEVNEVAGTVSLETTFRMYWRDERIEIRNDSLPDSHKHPNKTFIPLHPDVAKMIWVPDIFIDQAVALRKPTLHTAPTSIRMYKDGLIRYSTRCCTNISNNINIDRLY